MKTIISLFIVVFATSLVNAQGLPTVDETMTQAFLRDGKLQVLLSVDNRSKRTDAFVHLELISVEDKVLESVFSTHSVEKGRNGIFVEIPFKSEDASDNFIWTRLRYTISAGKDSKFGIVSLSEIMPELFEIHAISAEQFYAGSNYVVRIQTIHPTKFNKIANVKLDAELKIEIEKDGKPDELKLNIKSETDKDGLAILTFKIPKDIKFTDAYDEVELKINGEKSGLKNSLEEDINARSDRTSFFITTDKPLYQPNQKIYIRSLALDYKNATDTRKAVADKEVTFKIKDEDGTVLYREVVKTSRFGIASIEWQLPDNAKLGRYRVIVNDSSNEDDYSSMSFKVSRYELPNFIVNPETDKKFYLAEDKTAKVTVNAEYLFGKPVADGTVKIIRESEREWNYTEQKWDVEEEETYEGKADKDGKFEAKIDLTESHKEIEEDDDEKFQDLEFTAYFTDSTTNLTEERRFDIRISREAIHLYVQGLDSDEEYNNKFPMRFFVNASSADGQPLESDIEIKAKYDDDSKQLKTLGKFKTNKYGVAKVEVKLPKCEEGCLEDLILKIFARDSDNQTGTYLNEEFQIDDDEKQILIKTNKIIYKKGEPITLDILSTEKDKLVYLDVKKYYTNVLFSSSIKLKNGRGKLKIPYDESFKNSLNIIAYFDDGDGDAVNSSVGVVYPTPTKLGVSLETDKETFRPAENATLKFLVESPNKTFGENALGVFILDKAVEQRALTDSNFGGAFNPFADFQGLLGKSGHGGITVDDLQKLDLNKPISKDLQIVAEFMFSNYYDDPNFFSDEYAKNLSIVFQQKIEKQFENIKKILDEEYKNSYKNPTDEQSFRGILGDEENEKFDEMVDPWGSKYKVEFSPEGKFNVLRFKSLGANKQPDIYEETVYNDDFTVFYERYDYFKETGILIDKAVTEYFRNTGNFVRNEETLKKALAEQNFNFDELKDRWGMPYKIEFGVERENYTISFTTGNKDKKFNTERYGNDFVIWTNTTPYFEKSRIKIQEVLDKYVKNEKKYPKTEDEFKAVLKNGGVDFDSLRDGWDRPFYIEVETNKRFVDRVNIESVGEVGKEPQDKYVITPNTQETVAFIIRSLGKEGKKAESWSYSNHRIATFIGIVSEQAKDDAKPKLVVPKAILSNGNSLIFGTIYDSENAVIPNVELILKNKEGTAEQRIKSNEQGAFLFQNIPADTYSLRVSSTGFKTSLVKEITVTKNNYVEVNVKLQVGNFAITVEVTAGSSLTIDNSDTKIDTNIVRSSITVTNSVAIPRRISGGVIETSQIDGASGSESIFVVDGQDVTNFRSGTLNENNNLPLNAVTKSGSKGEKINRVETPRVRNYFPETLLWLPEIITTADGKATFRFKLADNITTWKIYAIASNLEGNVGVVEKEIKTFQPFFVDLLPPRILTKDDEIFLPVQVRNYTDKEQKVDVEMAKADWFSPLNSTKQNVLVSANATQNAIFGFRASQIIDEGSQKVTAIADKESDAIEKPVTVKPNGKEIVQKDTAIFDDSTTFDLNFPANALPNTQEAELKIYPNLFAHVSESVEGLLQRPYGCGEQTVSSTYPNLMILKFTKEDNRLRPFAQKYLQKGYEKLLGYQMEDGGFSYWGGDDKADIALTAYAIRFLSDAKEFIEVDEDVIGNAQGWLVKQQGKDGSWTTKYRGENVENSRRTWQISTYVARTLAITNKDKETASTESELALVKAFNYLEKRNAEIDEPYALANYGLALLDAGRKVEAKEISDKLADLAIEEGESVYWKLETNTPFYGWGKAGRIETTALVLQLFNKIETQKKTATNNTLIQRGTLFLLKNKDRYGVWYSTQTTVNVLDAFLASLKTETNPNQTKRVAEFFVNGQKVEDLELPSENELGYPKTLKLSKSLAPQNNRIEIKINGNSVSTMAQIVADHYINWEDFSRIASNTNQSRQIALDYKCDKLNAVPTEEITCDVKAERIGFKGYGMLLAEIGIPPGADVDRASLDKAKNEDWSFSRYDVLPDRIIIYMWSKAGGSSFKFKFKPRYGINAQTPASFVYDYYNEEAKATIAPMRFLVKSN